MTDWWKSFRALRRWQYALLVFLSIIFVVTIHDLDDASSFRYAGRTVFAIALAFVIARLSHGKSDAPKRLRNAAQRLRNQTPNLKVLGIFRIAFGLLTLITAVRTLQHFSVLFYDLEHPVVREGFKLTVYLWAALGIAITLGWGGRTLRFVNLVVAALLLRNFFTFGIFESTYILNAWLAAVAPCDFRYCLGQPNTRQCSDSVLNSGLPVFFVGFHFGFIFLYVGLDKLICPLWSSGNGFYNFAVLPWVLPPFLDWIVDIKPLMTIGNIGGLVVETSFIVLWLFGKLRPIAVAGMLALTLGLCFPFNIFLIGPLALAFSLGLVSLVVPEKQAVPTTEPKPVAAAWFLVPLYSVVFFVPDMIETFARPTPVATLATHFEDSADWQRGQDVTAMVHGTAATTFEDELTTDLHLREFTADPWQSLGNWFLGSKRYALFSKRHTLGVYAYRIQIETTDGKRLEPVHYFASDCERPDLWNGMLELNCYQGAMYAIGDVARWASFGRLHAWRLENIGTTLVESMMQHTIEQSQLETAAIKRVILLTQPMKTSQKWQGQLEPSSNGWTELLVYNPALNKYRLGVKPASHKHQGRDPSVPNYLPYLNESI